jgi:hypothetical protein
MSRCVGLSSAYECCALRITSHDGPQDVENVLPVSDEVTTRTFGGLLALRIGSPCGAGSDAQWPGLLDDGTVLTHAFRL